MECEICGYSKSEKALRTCEDGIVRCNFCVSRLVIGEVVTDKMIMDATIEQANEWAKKYENYKWVQ